MEFKPEEINLLRKIYNKQTISATHEIFLGLIDKGALTNRLEITELGKQLVNQDVEWRVIIMGHVKYEGDDFLGFADNMETAKAFIQSHEPRLMGSFSFWVEDTPVSGAPSADYVINDDLHQYDQITLYWSKKL